ncbi:unannotated protein [freshwater metagenome]|uniref:Unannotated protein n=1 Tax=freshwater metagenome TaxID=449393 RepID=A0A6J6IY68_9ZZZZ
MQQPAIALGDGLVDDLSEQQCWSKTQQCLNHDDDDERGDRPSVWVGIGKYPANSAATERLTGDRIAIAGHH